MEINSIPAARITIAPMRAVIHMTIVTSTVMMAAMEFRRHKTSIVPHETPERLIQSGIFRRSRNPIYLGDALILAGLILRWDAVLALPLIPVFVWVIEKRFVIPEEDRMRRKFRMDFARYCEKTRRWL